MLSSRTLRLVGRRAWLSPFNAAARLRVPGTWPPGPSPGRANAMKVNDLLELEVRDVVLGGKALARHEGRVVFLDRGLPGDRVSARRGSTGPKPDRCARRLSPAGGSSCPPRSAPAGLPSGPRTDETASGAVRETLEHLGVASRSCGRPAIGPRAAERWDDFRRRSGQPRIGSDAGRSRPCSRQAASAERAHAQVC
jgi:hypothetical protein